jgi:spermidine synthase
MKSALRPGGIVCSQGETVWTCLDLVHNMLSHCNAHFPNTSYAYTCVPTYPTGQIGFVLGSLDDVRDNFCSKDNTKTYFLGC